MPMGLAIMTRIKETHQKKAKDGICCTRCATNASWRTMMHRIGSERPIQGETFSDHVLIWPMTTTLMQSDGKKKKTLWSVPMANETLSSHDAVAKLRCAVRNKKKKPSSSAKMAVQSLVNWRQVRTCGFVCSSKARHAHVIPRQWSSVMRKWIPHGSKLTRT